jgi:hypothetical protein
MLLLLLLPLPPAEAERQRVHENDDDGGRHHPGNQDVDQGPVALWIRHNRHLGQPNPANRHVNMTAAWHRREESDEAGQCIKGAHLERWVRGKGHLRCAAQITKVLGAERRANRRIVSTLARTMGRHVCGAAEAGKREGRCVCGTGLRTGQAATHSM